MSLTYVSEHEQLSFKAMKTVNSARQLNKVIWIKSNNSLRKLTCCLKIDVKRTIDRSTLPEISMGRVPHDSGAYVWDIQVIFSVFSTFSRKGSAHSAHSALEYYAPLDAVWVSAIYIASCMVFRYHDLLEELSSRNPKNFTVALGFSSINGFSISRHWSNVSTRSTAQNACLGAPHRCNRKLENRGEGTTKTYGRQGRTFDAEQPGRRR